MEIRLKSQLTRAGDYKTIDLSRFARPIEVDQQKLDRMLLKYRTRFAEKQEVAEIADRDMATLTMESENPRFNKSHITARIGLGMLTRELENQLIGAGAGQTLNLIAKGTPVKVTVEKIIREIVPPLTEELVQKAAEPGKNSVDDVINACLTELYMDDLEIECDDAFAYLSRENEKQSEYQLDQEDREIAFHDLMIMMSGKMEAELPAEGENSQAPAPTENEKDEAPASEEKRPEEADAPVLTTDQVRDMADGMLFAALMGQQILLEESDGLYTDEDYERYLVAEAGRRLDTPEHIRAEVHPRAFALWEYSTIYMDRLEEYVAEELVRLSTKGEK